MMSKLKLFPNADAQFLSYANIPHIADHNFKLTKPVSLKVRATKPIRKPRMASKPAKKPDPVRSAKSTLAWNIIYADKMAKGWRPKKATPRFKAFLEYQKAKAVMKKAEAALNKSKSNQNSTVDCIYTVAPNLKSAQNGSSKKRYA